MKITHYIPREIVDLIADYHDYDKYCRPKHQEKFKEVINDIGDMASIMPTIIPNLAWQCWGPGHMYLHSNTTYHISPYPTWEETLENNFGMDYDDEENNFGLDYDDTHYYSHNSHDTHSYSEEEDDQEPMSWYNGWDSDN